MNQTITIKKINNGRYGAFVSIQMMPEYAATIMVGGGADEATARMNGERNTAPEKIEDTKNKWLAEYAAASKFAQSYFLDFEIFKKSPEAQAIIARDLHVNHTEQDEDVCLTRYWNAAF